jgi:Resolvase, N terminal domain
VVAKTNQRRLFSDGAAPAAPALPHRRPRRQPLLGAIDADGGKRQGDRTTLQRAQSTADGVERSGPSTIACNSIVDTRSAAVTKMISNGKFVAYYRVSTARQGKSGLGLEAQRQAVATYLNGGDWKIVSEHTEIESGRRADRPQLDKALTAARLHRCPLVVQQGRPVNSLCGLPKPFA